MILISITSVIVEVGVNIFYIMPDFKEMLENNTKAGMKDYAVSYSLKINGIEKLDQDPALQSALINQDKSMMWPTQILRNFTDNSNVFQQIDLVTLEGKVIASTKAEQAGSNLSQEKYISSAADGEDSRQSDILYMENGEKIAYVIPFHDASGQVKGLLAGYASPDSYQKEADTFSLSIAKDTMIYLVDGKYRIAELDFTEDKAYIRLLRRNDETGEMCRSTARMTERFHDIVQSIGTTSEIGKLAGESADSVSSIFHIVEEVNQAVDNMAECLEDMLNFIEKTVICDYDKSMDVSEEYETDSQSMKDAMYRIRESAAILDRNMKAIAASVSDINQTVGEAAEDVLDMSQKNAEMVGMTDKTFQMAQKSKKSSTELSEIIKLFRL